MVCDCAWCGCNRGVSPNAGFGIVQHKCHMHMTDCALLHLPIRNCSSSRSFVSPNTLVTRVYAFTLCASVSSYKYSCSCFSATWPTCWLLRECSLPMWATRRQIKIKCKVRNSLPDDSMRFVALCSDVTFILAKTSFVLLDVLDVRFTAYEFSVVWCVSRRLRCCCAHISREQSSPNILLDPVPPSFAAAACVLLLPVVAVRLASLSANVPIYAG